MRRYIDFDPTKGYPAGKTLFYECLRCGTSIPSRPAASTGCPCSNLVIDIDYGRVSVDDHSLMRIYDADRNRAIRYAPG